VGVFGGRLFRVEFTAAVGRRQKRAVGTAAVNDLYRHASSLSPFFSERGANLAYFYGFVKAAFPFGLEFV